MTAASQNTTPSPEARSFLGREHRLLIGGNWVAASGRETIDVFDPSSEAHLATVSGGGKDDIDRAVAAARKAFRGEWSKLTAYERTRLIWKLAKKSLRFKAIRCWLRTQSSTPTAVAWPPAVSIKRFGFGISPRARNCLS